MKKLIALLLVTMMTIGLVACGKQQSTDTTAETEKSSVTITSLNGNKEEIELEVPYNPQRIAILDLAALDIIDNLGMGDRIVGAADT